MGFNAIQFFCILIATPIAVFATISGELSYMKYEAREPWVVTCRELNIPTEAYCQCPYLPGKVDIDQCQSRIQIGRIERICQRLSFFGSNCSCRSIQQYYLSFCGVSNSPQILPDVVRRACNENKVPLEKCSCPSLFSAANLTTTMCRKPGGISSGDNRHSSFTLEEACKLFKISAPCECPGILKEIPHFSLICDMHNQTHNRRSNRRQNRAVPDVIGEIKNSNTTLHNNQTLIRKGPLSNDISTFTLVMACKKFDIKVPCECPGIIKVNAKFSMLCAVHYKTLNRTALIVNKCKVNPYLNGQKIFTIVASIFGIIGNGLVIVIRSKQWDNLHYKLICGLALADLIFSVLQIVYNAPVIDGSCRWIYKLAMCKILHGLLGLSYSIDLGFIVIISIERFVAVCHPHSGFLQRPIVVYILVICNFVYSLVGVIPAFMVLEIDDAEQCVENWRNFPMNSLQYSWILLVFYFIIPVFITAVLYKCSMCALHKALVRRMSISVQESSRARQLQESRRILLVLMAILTAMVLLVSPNRIVWLVADYIGYSNLAKSTYDVLMIVASVPFSLTIMINPVIYSLVDRRFRKNAMFLFKNYRRRRSTFNVNLSTTGSTAINNTIQMVERQYQPTDSLDSAASLPHRSTFKSD